MNSETEVHFCNICNTSIPESAIREGKAVRVDGKAIPTAGAGTSGDAHKPGRATLLGAAVLVCAAVAGATVFIDWRLSDEGARLQGGLDASAPRMGRVEERLTTVEERLANVARANQFGAVEEGLRTVGDSLRATAARTDAGIADANKERSELRQLLQQLADAQIQQAARLALLQDDLRALGRDLAELRAAPVTAQRMPVDDSGHGSDVEPRGEPTPGADALPAALQHQIDRLGDADESVRFEAVQELLGSHDERVLPKLLPLAKDTDFFVRRLVLEGLAEHRSAEHVELMLTALADPESLVRHSAFQGLKKLTGQSFPFDADASAEQRASMQRRWRTWWDKAKAEF